MIYEKRRAIYKFETLNKKITISHMLQVTVADFPKPGLPWPMLGCWVRDVNPNLSS